MPALFYAFDPLCGWCYGVGPVVAKVASHFPVRLAVNGLVVGGRVRPTAEMIDYFVQASERLKQFRGRARSQAFHDWARKPTSVGASAPSAVAVHTVIRQAPRGSPRIRELCDRGP